MNKDKESEVKSPPPAAELAALSPSGRSPPQAAPREVHAATSDEPPPHPPQSLIADATQKKRGRKRKPALESVDPDEAKRIHNLNNKKLRDDQNELFTQLKRMVGIEAQAKKTTVLIRVVEHMQRQEEIIGSLRRKLQELEQQTLPKVAAPSEPRPSALHEHPEGVEAAPMREAALVEQLTGAQKALHAMQASQGELKAELERFKTRMKTSERGSPTSMKHDAPRRMSEKKIPLGTPAILPKLRPGDEVPRDDVRKAAPIDPLASLTTLALAADNARPTPASAGAAGAAPISIAPTPPPAVAPLLPSLLPTPPIPASITFPTPALPTSPSRAIVPPASPSRAVAASIAPLSASVPLVVSISAPPTVSLAPPTAPPPPLFALSPPPMPQLPPAAIGPEPEIRSTLHDWLGSADLRLSFWRHGKALRHQPGRQLPVSDKIASRLYKLPRPLFDCRNSGRDVKHEESSLSSCASPSCCRPNEDNNWMTLPCGDRIHKECYTDPAQGCFASRSVFFVPPPSVQLWRTGDTVSLVPQNASSDKPLGCIPCFAKNDAPALAIPFSMLGALKDHINTAERVLSHVEVQQGEFKGDAVVEIESDEEAKDETPAATRAHRGSSPSNSPSPASASSHSGDHLYPLMHHLTAVATSSVLHLCFKQTTSIRHRSHRRDAVEVVRVFRLRFSPPEGQALLSPWFFLAATSWSSLAERGAKMVPGEHATGQAVLDALLESGGGLD